MDIFRQLSKYLLPSNPLKPPIPEGMSLFPLSPIVPKNGLISEKLQDFFLSCIASPPFLCYHKPVNRTTVLLTGSVSRKKDRSPVGHRS